MRRRPTVLIHVAQSLDGRLGFAGKTTLLSNAEGRRTAHIERAGVDAVLVGAATVRIDDPRLTVRECAGKDPLRVVLASTLAVPHTARIFADERVLVIGAEGRAIDAERRWLEQRAAVVGATPDGLVRLDEALEMLAERGVEDLLVEGGSRVVTSFLRARLVDRMQIEIAPRFIGEGGTPIVGALDPGDLPRLENLLVERNEDHIVVFGDVRHD